MAVDEILARQAGVISRAQAVRAGLSPDAVDRLLARRRWRPLHPRVYLAPGHHRGTEARVRAAVLWAGEGAVLSGLAASWWHGMVQDAPVAVGVTVARRRRPATRPGVTVRCRSLAAEDVTMWRGVAVTGRPLSVLEAAVESGSGGGVLLDRALQRWVRYPAVHEAYRRSLGSPGSATAGRLLVAAAERAEPATRRLLQRMLRDAGISGWRPGSAVGEQAMDIAFPASRVAIEVTGWAWHADGDRARRDALRRDALARQCWTVLRYSWHDLVQRPGAVVAEILGVIDAERSATA
jgi:very-short-patch-repair endonuclease